MSVSGLPTELLHSIIAWITVEYIDDLIVGSLKLPTLPILEQVNPLRELKEEEDPSHKAPNPIAPLLSVSYQFRATTLHILSRALDIPLSPISPNVDRLTVKPWNCIQPIRMMVFKACAVDVSKLDGGPLLKPYLMLAMINLSYDLFELTSVTGRVSEVSSHVGRIMSHFLLARQLAECIQPAVLRTSLTSRLSSAGTRLGTFVCVRVLLPLLADSFEQFNKIAKDATRHPQDQSELCQTASVSLLSQLTLVRTLQDLLVQVGFLNHDNRGDVIPVCEFLDSILCHEDMPGTDFYQCKQLACDLRAKFTSSMPLSAAADGKKIPQGGADGKDFVNNARPEMICF